MRTKNASDEKTVREADLKGCQRQGKKTDYRSNPKNRAYSRVECSDLWGRLDGEISSVDLRLRYSILSA